MVVVWCDPAAAHHHHQEEESTKQTCLAKNTPVWTSMVNLIKSWFTSIAPLAPSLPSASSRPEPITTVHLVPWRSAMNFGDGNREPNDAFHGKSESEESSESLQPLQEEDRMIPEWAQRKLSMQRDLALGICRCAGIPHYGSQDHSLVTTTFGIFRRLIPDSIPVSDFDHATLPVRVRMALLASFSIAMKFDDDFIAVPCLNLVRQLLSAEEAKDLPSNDRMLEAIAYVETHIVGSVNVFDVSQNNHHRKAVEVLVQMTEDEHVDDHSAVRATALSFFFVFNTYGEVELLSRSYDTYTIGKAIAIATLFCLESAQAAPTPRKRWGTRHQFHLARLLLREISLKGEFASKRELGGALVDPKAWECKATRQETVQNAIDYITAHLS